MPELENLAVAELAAVLPPDEPDLAEDALAEAVIRRVAHVDAGLVRAGQVAELYEFWGRRLDRVQPPPNPRTLQELVAAARQALRRRRLTGDRTRLDRRDDVLSALRVELTR